MTIYKLTQKFEKIEAFRTVKELHQAVDAMGGDFEISPMGSRRYSANVISCGFAGFCGGVTGFWGVGVCDYLVLLVRARVGRSVAFWVCKSIMDCLAAVQGVDLLRC